MIPGARYVVQRSRDGGVQWVTRGSRDEHGDACTLASQLAERLEFPGEMFRVVDTKQNGRIAFEVQYP